MLQHHPIDPNAIKTTGRKLVEEFFGNQPVAAALTLVGALYGLFILPESLRPENRAPFVLTKANPFGSLQFLASHRELLTLSSVNFLLQLAHCVLPTIFVLYASNRYGWNLKATGAALALTGVCNVVVQGICGSMASFVNGSRYGNGKSIACEHLVEAATGLALAPQELTDQLRLATALEFHEFQTDVPGVVNGDPESIVCSRWHFASAPAETTAPEQNVPI